MTKEIRYIFLFIITSLFFSCNNSPKKDASIVHTKDTSISCIMVPSRFANASMDPPLQFNGDTSTKGMVFIKGDTFMMGGDNSQASADEYPKHKAEMNSFWIDANEVTNAGFQKFVNAIHYITTAEKKPDWNEVASNEKQSGYKFGAYGVQVCERWEIRIYYRSGFYIFTIL